MTSGSFAPLVAVAVGLLGTPVAAACEDPFVREDGGDRIEVSLAWGRGFVRIGASEERRMHDDPQWSAGLYSHFETDAGRLFRPVFWSPGASLSLGAPDVSDAGAAGENRVRFGDQRPLRDRRIGWEHFGARSEPWTWSASLGPAPLERFARTGSVRVEHWSGPSRRRLGLSTWARYDWDRVERLVQLARDHFQGCPATGA